ncbi:hypothetical protein FFI97_031030 [Variovorax sp. KBS0712]|uniref:hypothetical protein n=1 Tax=Variovorax sp. KBS0712 TaxID=2578111 RepID=UPI0011198780|nr:hypothetical protein [Variovorax sp. KBS0712]TSD53192.1 hypothetical protein FFI97_031030 [Variovorax sp. KBS0712]
MFTNATPLLDQLLASHIIDEVAHDAAKQRLEDLALSREPFDTLGIGLFWLLDNEIVSADLIDELEMRSQQEEEGAFAANSIHKQVVAEFAAHLAALQRASVERQFWLSMFPGPRWAWLTGGAAAVVFAGWFFLAPDATPSCEDERVAGALRRALVEVAFGDSSRRWPGTAEDRSNLLLARFTHVKEIGYIKAERSRGCAATLTLEDSSLPIAFTVGPEKGSKEIMVRTGDRRVIEARYGRANKDGTLPTFGAPIGKAQLSAAFSSGVEAFEKKTASINASALKEMDRRRGIDPDRKTVQSVEPLADCLVVEPGKKYACRLQVQYIDRAMAILGKSETQVVQGDFDFVKQGAGWAVSDNFSRQYLDAVVRGRLGALKGDEAARKLEEIQKNRGKEGASANN